MTDTTSRTNATEDVVAVLTEQHERIKSLFAQMDQTSGMDRQATFDELRELLAVHETAEEMVLRPATRSVGGADIAEQRNTEEKEATAVLAELEEMGCDDARFDGLFSQFQADVLRHAQAEESLEFPLLLAHRDADQRAQMGRSLRSIEKLAPTHPHPSTAGSTVKNAVVGPFAALVDRVRDALSEDTRTTPDS